MLRLIEKIDGRSSFAEVSAPRFEESFDVAVIGLGTAGAVSAIVCTDKQLKTLGIERFNAAGGTMTVGGITSYYFGGNGGEFERIDQKLCDKKEIVLAKDALHNPDLRKYNLDCEFERTGVTAVYDSVVTGLYVENRKIVGIRVFDGEKENDISVKLLIDATGEGEICDMAGCSMDFGRKTDGGVVPFTVVRSYISGGRLCNTNHDSGKFDQRDPWAFSRAVLEGQGYFAKKTDQQKTLRLQSLPGIREGRLLNGEKKVTSEDFLCGKYEKEPVIYAYADLDKHGHDVAFDSEIFRKWNLMSNLGALNISVPIPKECLIAKEYDNLMVAGRLLSVDREMQTCVRMNRDMQKLGEVAAIIAKVALEENIPLKNVRYDRVLPFLLESGCLSEENNKGFRFDIPSKNKTEYFRKAEWLTDEKSINRELSTLKPGLAIWSCRLLGGKIIPTVQENLKSNDENLRKHSAVALAVMDDPSGVEVLRSMVKDRDRTELQDMRKNNKQRIAMALCGLSVLKDEASIELIKEFIADKNEPSFYPEQAGFKQNYYIALSMAVVALMHIADAHEHRRQEIEEFLEAEFSSLEYIKSITVTGEYTSQFVMCKDIYKNISVWKNCGL